MSLKLRSKGFTEGFLERIFIIGLCLIVGMYLLVKSGSSWLSTDS